MFSRIQEAIRIITYREPQGGPDAVIMEHEVATSSRPGRFISRGLEVIFVVYALARIAGSVGEKLEKLIPSSHSISVGTLAGAVGVLLMFLLHSIKDDIQAKIQTRLNLAEILAPYFGHRLDYTIRVLKS